MRKLIFIAAWIVTIVLSFTENAQACTDFKLTAKDGTTLITRSMEFALDLKSNLRSSAREKSFSSITPDGKPGLAWQAKYGYLYLDALGVPAVVDGMNEQGLSFEYLYLPGETQYQQVPAGQENNAIPYMNFGNWVLSNFKTVAEVKQALASVYVFAQKIPAFGDEVFPLHAAIYDASGHGIIVEFVKGKMHVYENTLGVLTNSPTYDWHLTNMRNYINLTPVTPQPVIAQGITYAATGQGAGMLGLPGDVSPPSRFVKVAIMKQTVLATADATDTLNLAQHIINNVDIPLGFVREAQSGKVSNELTQWVVFKDLSNKIFYYRSYTNLNLRAVNLTKIDFTKDALELSMPIASPAVIEDVTYRFKREL